MRSRSALPPSFTAVLVTLATLAFAAAAAAGDDRKPPAASDPELKKRIDVAVDAGTRWLFTRQGEKGTWPAFGMHDYSYEVGPTALACYALIHSGINRSDPRLHSAFEFLFSSSFRRTYEVSLCILALEAKATPPKDVLAQKYVGASERQLLPDENEWLKKAVQWLVDRRKGDYWSYPIGNGDHSNTQFALLALKAASRCGVKAPKEVWLNACQHFVRWQEKSGPEMSLVLDKGVDARGYAQIFKRRTEARGWTYDKPCPPGEAYGSMTAIGIASLILCRSEITGHPKYSDKLSGEIDQGVRDGLAWMQQSWSIAENPKRKLDYHYYYLYALERVGMLAEIVKLGEHDWFREGAEFLLAHQEPDGRWRNEAGWGSDECNTCYALLFLKRSTLPSNVNTTPRVEPSEPK
jgi:hypothetical protein